MTMATHYFVVLTIIQVTLLVGGAYICVEEGGVSLVMVTALKCTDEQVGDGQVGVAPTQHSHHAVPRPVGEALTPPFIWPTRGSLSVLPICTDCRTYSLSLHQLS